MRRELVEKKLREIIKSRFYIINENSIVSTSVLDDDLGLDSLDRLELLMFIEREFDVSFSDEIAKQITDFHSLVNCVVAATER